MKSKLLRKHLLSIAIFVLVLIIAFGAVINEMVIRIMFRHYENMERGAARFMSNTINADRISAYLETNEPDLYYSALVDMLSLLCEDYDFTYAYVAVPEEEGLRYPLYDRGIDAAQTDDRVRGHLDRGDFSGCLRLSKSH